MAIIASTIDTVKKLLPNYPIYNEIKGQTFLRLYGKFTGCSIEIMKNLRCADDAIIVPTKITDEFLKQNDFDYVVYPKTSRVKQENGIIECDLINKINC